MFLCLPFFKKYRVSFSKISFLPSLLSLSHILQTYVVLGLPTVQQARGRLLRRKPRGIAVKTQIWYDVVSWGRLGLRGIIINHQNHRYICCFLYCALILVYWLVETPFFLRSEEQGWKLRQCRILFVRTSCCFRVTCYSPFFSIVCWWTGKECLFIAGRKH